MELYEKYLPIAKRDNANISETELYNKCIQWSREELQSKFRHYPMIILALVDSVHATFLRALNGEERTSLRKQLNIHQSLNDNNMFNQQQKKGGFGVMSMFGK